MAVIAAGKHVLVAVNALTNVPIAEIPVSSLHHSRVVNDNGVLEATCLLSDPAVAKLGLLTLNALEPAYVTLYCYRDNVVDWAGILWSHAYDSTTGIITLEAAEFGSYLSSRFIIANQSYNADVATLAGTWAQQVFNDGGPLSSAGGLPLAITTTGTSLVGSFFAYEQHNVAYLLTGYTTQSPGGIDWSFDVRDNDANGNARPTFVVSAPRRGRVASATNAQWDYPVHTAAYTLTKSAQDGEFATELIVTGAGSGATLLQAVKAVPMPGYIKLQSVINDANLASQAAVNGYAIAQANILNHNGASMVFSSVILGSVFYGSGVDTGDEVTLRVVDPYFASTSQVVSVVSTITATPAVVGSEWNSTPTAGAVASVGMAVHSVTAGHDVLAVASCRAGTLPTTCVPTDSNGNAWSLVASIQSTNVLTVIYRSTIAVGKDGNTTITWTPNANAGIVSGAVEVSGLDPTSLVDVFSMNDASTGTAIDSLATATPTTVAKDFILGVLGAGSGIVVWSAQAFHPSTSPTTGNTESATGTTVSQQIAYEVATATGTQEYTGTSAPTGQWTAGIAAFKPLVTTTTTLTTVPGGAPGQLVNKRILGWDCIPATDQAPELVKVTFGDPLVGAN